MSFGYHYPVVNGKWIIFESARVCLFGSHMLFAISLIEEIAKTAYFYDRRYKVCKNANVAK